MTKLDRLTRSAHDARDIRLDLRRPFLDDLVRRIAGERDDWLDEIAVASSTPSTPGRSGSSTGGRAW